MIVPAWRLVRAARQEDAFSGHGARLYGGRWNPRGMRATYLSASRSLAALEVIVHQAEHIPHQQFLFFEARFPEEFVADISPDVLAADWRSYPPRKTTVEAGGMWLKALSSPVLRVPSVLIPEEFNFIINPEHPKAAEIKIPPPQVFAFDQRFIKAQR